MNETAAPDLSIVVACRNEERQIDRFLDSLAAQDFGGFSWEVIIADGMSEDGTRRILEEYCRRWPQVRLVDNPARFVSNGLNNAILAARGATIIRMDAHTHYACDYCQRCVETLERTGADNVGGPARTEAVGNRARAIAAAYHSRFSTGGGKFHDETYEGWVDTVPYGCWRRKTLLRLGLFDEALVRDQDDELNLRLRRAGGKIWQAPEILSWYSPRATLGTLFRQYFQYGFWKVAVIRRHRLPDSWRHFVPCGFVLAIILLLAGTALVAATGSSTSGCVLLWVALAGLYTCVTLAASVDAARRSGWEILPYLPLVFATYHFAYGLGFLFGVVSIPWRFSGAQSSMPLLTRITR